MSDFNFLIASYKEDFDKSNTLQTPFVRNGHVYYICTSDVIESRADKLEMIATYIFNKWMIISEVNLLHCHHPNDINQNLCTICLQSKYLVLLIINSGGHPLPR